jgi:hypothetical protein
LFVVELVGWTVLQEACLLKNRQVVFDLHLNTVMLKQAEWERNLPNLQKTLSKVICEDDMIYSLPPFVVNRVRDHLGLIDT